MWLNNANTTKSSLRFYVWYTVQSMWYVALERGRPRKLSKVNEWAFCTEDRLCTYLLCTHGTRVFLWVFVISDSKTSWNSKCIQLATDSKLITNGIVASLLCICCIDWVIILAYYIQCPQVWRGPKWSQLLNWFGLHNGSILHIVFLVPIRFWLLHFPPYESPHRGKYTVLIVAYSGKREAITAKHT